jgi:hypothetical protein
MQISALSAEIVREGVPLQPSNLIRRPYAFKG